MNTRQPGEPPEDTIRRAWHDASAERPPDRVDEAILAAARSAVDAGRPAQPRREWFHRWQPMLAAAAVAGIAFVLVQTLPREPGITTRSTSPPQAVAPPREAPREAPRGLPATSVPESEPVPPPPVPESNAKPTRREPPHDATTRSTATADAAPAAAREEPAITGGLMSKAAAPRAISADDAIASSVRRVVELYERGDTDAAAAELRHARTLSPTADDRLPEPLRAWARTVQP